MKRIPSSGLKAQRNYLQYELTGVRNALRNPNLGPAKLAGLQVEAANLAEKIREIGEELEDRRAYWRATHAPRGGFTLGDRARLAR